MDIGILYYVVHKKRNISIRETISIVLQMKQEMEHI